MRIISLAAAALILATTGAAGESITDEISGYRNINVKFSKQAAKCELSNASMFADRLAEKFTEIGVNRFDKSITEANIGINATAFGTLNTSCTYFVELTFSSVLRADNIVTDDPAARAAIDRLKSVPVIIYKAGRFGTVGLPEPSKGGPSTAAQERVLKDIDVMVTNFAALRTQ